MSFHATIACLVFARGLISTFAVNSFAEVSVQPGNYISWISGKFNVPNKPKASSQGSPYGPMYLWPGLDPYGQDCGLWQPVLGFADSRGEWWISNWFSHCPGVAGGYCHDPAQTVYPGDEISFWIRYVGGMDYEMGYSSPHGSSTMRKPCHTGLPRAAWIIEVESYFQLAANPYYYNYMPTSPWRVWDVVIRDMNNREVTSGRLCRGTNEKPLTCDWGSNNFVESFRRYSNLSSTPSLVSHPVMECKGNEACESVQGRVPGRLAQMLAVETANSSKNVSGVGELLV
jgi:hypothetical protein|eukprot:TRINITY_DN74789_c0_g1_i1.p1 TRINITY_DN74789_c0_g1~~TRINITY_DN74789_c0_g1_i1.p1  ORF type:complete len:286 (-),score=12.15 TRINITY_DN74789_c0_g1_i1:96-953(-)